MRGLSSLLLNFQRSRLVCGSGVNRPNLTAKYTIVIVKRSFSGSSQRRMMTKMSKTWDVNWRWWWWWCICDIYDAQATNSLSCLSLRLTYRIPMTLSLPFTQCLSKHHWANSGRLQLFHVSISNSCSICFLVASPPHPSPSLDARKLERGIKAPRREVGESLPPPPSRVQTTSDEIKNQQSSSIPHLSLSTHPVHVLDLLKSQRLNSHQDRTAEPSQRKRKVRIINSHAKCRVVLLRDNMLENLWKIIPSIHEQLE